MSTCRSRVDRQTPTYLFYLGITKFLLLIDKWSIVHKIEFKFINLTQVSRYAKIIRGWIAKYPTILGNFPRIFYGLAKIAMAMLL